MNFLEFLLKNANLTQFYNKILVYSLKWQSKPDSMKSKKIFFNTINFSKLHKDQKSRKFFQNKLLPWMLKKPKSRKKLRWKKRKSKNRINKKLRQKLPNKLLIQIRISSTQHWPSIPGKMNPKKPKSTLHWKILENNALLIKLMSNSNQNQSNSKSEIIVNRI